MLLALLLGTPLVVVGDTFLVEPRWLKISQLKLAPQPRCRFVHFTDLHHKGDRKWLGKIVGHINRLSPEFVCFTGDIVEEERHLKEALELLAGIKAPIFGIPGNHDYWADLDFGLVHEHFARSGGAFLVNQSVPAAKGRVMIHGVAQLKGSNVQPAAGVANILLIHYSAWVEVFFDRRFEVILAGHTHGGQVRIPFYGPLLVPFDSGQYDLGLFQTLAGPFYVGAGVGHFFINTRFNCRPEITVVEV